MTARLFVADDQSVTRAGFVTVLSGTPGMTVVGTAEDAGDTLRQVRDLEPDVVLLNLRTLHGASLASLTERLRRPDHTLRSRPILIKSPETVVSFDEALRAGVRAYVEQSAAQQNLLRTILLVMADAIVCLPGDALPFSSGKSPENSPEGGGVRQLAEAAPIPEAVRSLTHREYTVLALLGEGLDNGEIARRLQLAETTVKKHVAHAMHKIGECSRVRAALFAFRYGLSTPASVR